MTSGEAGFALTEAIVSVGLIGLIAAVFITGLSNMYRADLIAKQQAVAESLARAQVESIKGHDYISYATVDHDVYELINNTDTSPDYTITASVVPVDPSTGLALDPGVDHGLQLITATVSRDGQTLLTLSDYKVLR